MANDLEIEIDDETGEEYVRIPKDQALNQRKLANDAQKNADALDRAEKAERKLAFRDAGIPNGVLGDMFMETYKGDLDVEKIKEAAGKVPGLVEAEATETQVELTPEQQAEAEAEARQTQERNNLSRGAAGYGEAPPPDPRKLASDTVQQAREAGRNDMDSLALGFAELVNAAGHGDNRARVAMPWDREAN